jgi:hypothetical protein
MNTIVKNMLIEFTLVTILLGWFFFVKNDQGVTSMFNEGPGAIIAAFGIIWAIGAFIRLSINWDSKIASMTTSVGLILFGYVLQEYGFFTAACTIGGFLIFVAYLISALSPQMATPIWIIGTILFIFCLPFKGCSSPTKRIEIDPPVATVSTLSNIPYATENIMVHVWGHKYHK